MAAERIDQRIEGPARELLGFALEEQLEEFDRTLQDAIDAGTVIPVMTLIARVATMCVVRGCGDRAPTEEDLERVSGEVVASYSGTYPLGQGDVHAYMSRVLFGGEPFDTVLGSEKSVVIPAVVTVTLLAADSDFPTWHEYLDVLEAGLEQTGATSGLSAPGPEQT